MKESGLYIIHTTLTGKCFKLYDLAIWKNGAAFKGVKASPTGKPIIKIAELNNGISESTTRTDDIFSEDILMHFGDLAFAWSGNPETSIDIFRYKLPDGWLNQHIFKITVNENKVDKDFFFYLMKYIKPNFKKIASNKQTTGLGHVTISDLKEISVILPDRNIQKYIAVILKSLDDKIEVNRRINENLEQQAQALFKSWFVDFEPFKNGEFVESELGMIPKGWRVYSLSEFLPVITGKKDANVAKGGPYPFFSCSQDYGWTDDYSFEGNAILVAGNGDFNVKMYNGKFEAYQRTYVLIPHNPQYTAWLFYAVKYHLNDITSAARGSVIKFITKGNLADFRFPAPSNLDKTEVIERFSCIKRIVASNQQESRRLAELRDTLLPKLMSGELKVNDIEK